LAFYLGDAVYTYLSCLNQTYAKYGPGQLGNATAIMSFLLNTTKNFPCEFLGVFLIFYNSLFLAIMGNNFTMVNGFRTGRYGRSLFFFKTNNGF
jgi:hypothetical protein